VEVIGTVGEKEGEREEDKEREGRKNGGIEN
jgi:hypothetical protein